MIVCSLLNTVHITPNIRLNNMKNRILISDFQMNMNDYVFLVYPKNPSKSEVLRNIS
jgi:hypothetical protein